ncbi:MAG: hypothetical protein LBT49_01740 [Prevotellaceae bacterium]|nr:hypothetical protein [Prevotellaceae bacterium]
MKIKKTLSVFTLFAIFLLSVCLPKEEVSILEQVLALAGESRPELKKVLLCYKQYPEDNLKYKAACFLIENMPYCYCYEGKALDGYAKLL